MTRSFEQSEVLYQRALQSIPQASQTFSKSAQNFVHGAAPLFLERGEGAYVYDVDGNRYIDFILGLAPIVLGYADADVNAAIRDQLERGISFTLATRLEAELAERLCRLIPCAERVRFAKNGSDVTSAAVRIARAATGRDLVAVCGYHGWHDWYIGTTSKDLGVPAAVKALSRSFTFNDAASLERLFEADPDGYAAVILEPTGSVAPEPGFLASVQSLCRAHGAVLIFDEIVTGFRVNLGGAQAEFGVTPDLACFGKSMANGMPLSALVGRADLMERMADVFVSGTFGGEALSLAAGIATVDKLIETDAINRIKRVGAEIRAGVVASLDRHGLGARLAVSGADWRPVIKVLDRSMPGNIAVSLLRQETAEAGLLFGSGFTLCLAHDDAGVLAETLAGWDQAVEALARAFESNAPETYLRGEPVRDAFQVRKS